MSEHCCYNFILFTGAIALLHIASWSAGVGWEKNLHVILPSCAVAKIYDKFSSVDYAQFRV